MQLSFFLMLPNILLSGFMFGWAKPVPVNFQNLRNPRWDSIWVAAAGPVPVVLQPNAGAPKNENGVLVYAATAADFAAIIPAVLKAPASDGENPVPPGDGL